MKRFAFRAVFVAMIAVSLVLRHQSIINRDQLTDGFDMTAAIAGVVQAAGLQLRANPVRPPLLRSRIVYFQRPGCSKVSLAVPFSLHVNARSFLDRDNMDGYTYRYVYLDQTWVVQDRAAMHLAWIKNIARSIFDSTPYLPLHTAIALAEPGACAAPETVDWAQAWSRARFDKSGVSPQSTGKAPPMAPN